MRKQSITRCGDPACDLVFAVINQASVDARNGDRGAAQFLVHRHGAELWLRSLGIGVTQKMRAELQRMARVE